MALALLLGGTAPHYIYASYNSLPRANAASLGMADANVALATGPSAQLINPANLLGREAPGAAWETGALFGRVEMDLSRDAPSPRELSAETGYPVIPFFAMGVTRSARFAYGFSVDVPFGVALEWPERAFEVNLGPLGLQDIAREAEITVFRAGPAFAWRVGERLGLGTRVFYQRVEAREVSEIGGAEGDGHSIGAQIGAGYRASGYALGAAYTLRTHTEIDGSTRRLGDPAPLPGKADIHVPARLQAGGAVELGPNLWWEIDLDWLGWSYIDELTIVRADGSILNAGRNARHFDDALSIRAGVRWQPREDRVLYAGLGYDPSPVDERDASPTINNLSMTRIGFGMGFLLAHGLKLDVAYQYVRGHSRRIRATGQDDIAGVDTGAFEGTYRSESHVLGVSLGGSF